MGAQLPQSITRSLESLAAAANNNKQPDAHPLPLLRIHFPEVTVTTPGTDVSIPAAAPTPTLSLSSSAIKPGTNKKYIAFSIDLDAPFPSWPILGPILHGIQTDLVVVADGAEGGGFVPLEAKTKEWRVVYRGPGPPRPSAPHRYVFLLFEQPEGVNGEKVDEVLGMGAGAGLWARIRWDQGAAERKLGLGEVVAVNYFVSHG
ncbi:phosphatidylethanolamine-binding protein [Echria macrotheca]|uniref:Phosphatidylethanolamine-binding protein n=1 Tax=Echria macrotheca TaxID=438768 RepID=A0AAJ0F9H5_9PEZI|nr:phosphatidylethanolamine-binding protein [Echria macrotheca]